jgi:hypothetical protein
LLEAVHGPGISKREVFWLGLESDFDRVEGILDEFSCHSCRLEVVTEV